MKADSKQVTDALVDMTGSAIERARSEPSADLLLADDEFLDLLASRVAEKLLARELLQQSNAAGSLAQATNAFAQIAAAAR